MIAIYTYTVTLPSKHMNAIIPPPDGPLWVKVTEFVAAAVMSIS